MAKSYHDPSRPRLYPSGPSCWEWGWVIPPLGFAPARDPADAREGKWLITALGGNGRFYTRLTSLEDIPEWLQKWQEDPEGTWEELFGEGVEASRGVTVKGKRDIPPTTKVTFNGEDDD